jgi:hypothetical protein
MTIKKITISLRLNILFILCLTMAAFSQTPAPTSTPGGSSTAIGDYEITSSIEVGARSVDVSGDGNKFRSDFNYRSGFRVFDSSFLFENNSKDRNPFDSALITTSGWGGDPTGSFRANFEKAGLYKFDSNLRRVKYFNFLNNHALGEHNARTEHDFGDLDLTLFPEWDKLRIQLGYSFNRTDGPGGYTTRAYSDEFGILTRNDTRSDDFRAGVDTKLAGFNLGFNYGHRKFDERTRYFIDGTNLGNNPTNNPRLFTFERLYPIEGTTDFGSFRLHRTFAEKFDLTARLIYSLTSTDFRVNETITGRDNSNNIVDLDLFTISGDSKRPQTRGDLGLTYRITNAFRVSDTVTYDQFHITGGNNFFEQLRRRNAAGTVTLAPTFTATLAYRVTGYKRTTNLLEADYQVSRRFAFNIGYRFTHREVVLDGFDRNLITNATTLHEEESSNRTHSVIAGLMAKPTNNWTIYADGERGKADNVFSRLGNYDYTNFRVRSRAGFKNFVWNASFITRDNDNPSQSIEVPPRDFTAETRTRIFSTSLDWNPRSDFGFSGGYTYNHLTAETNIIVPINGVRLEGISQYFVRNGYFFFDVNARPIKRLALFASYRLDDDDGQGDRVSTRAQDIVTSYPMRLHSPEVRIAFRVNKYIDWNVGYQYYDYKENFPNAQNYHAHMPYTSLRIYFGRTAEDR